jgi:hypothetical protein
MAEFVETLNAMNKEWGELTTQIGIRAMQNQEEVGAAAVDYLMYSGYITLAFFWAQMARVALDALQGETTEQAFYNTKVQTAQFYFKRLLPRTKAHYACIQAGLDTLMSIDEANFAF